MSDSRRIRTGPIPVVADPRPTGVPAGRKPLFLLADSQLLFTRGVGVPVTERIAACAGPAPRTAYLGASNGDQPEFYALFLAAMEPLGPAECRRITAAPGADERASLEAAEVIVLAGGDVERGWRAFEAAGVRQIVQRRREAGAVLVGVSAGAVQMGLAGWPEGHPQAAFSTWGFAPFVVDAHGEGEGWAALRAVVRAQGGGARGIGIPTGGGAVLHPDGTLEPLRHALAELVMGEEEIVAAALYPPGPARM
jgi:hypothetical protein